MTTSLNKKIRNNLNDKESFYSQLMKVALPVVIQQLIIVTVNMIDTIMVGKLSENSIAAVGAANQIYFVFIDCIFGFLSGTAVFAVQYWGIRDLKALRKILGISYGMVIAISIPIIALVYIFAPKLIGIFATEPEVVLLGTQYIRIACFTYFFGGLTFVISYFSRAVMMLKWPTILNGIAVLINIILNYGLIYGKLGLPELGVKGAAIATLIARVIEFVSTFIYVYMAKGHPLRAKIHEMIFDKTLYIRVMKTAVPVVFNETLWVLSFTIVFAIYGRLGATALAIVQVAMTINDFFQTIYIGVCNGCGVIIGQTLGQGNRELAYTYSKKILRITWVLNGVITLLLLFMRTPMARIYDFKPETTELLMTTLIVYALAMTPKMLSYVIICGILRPGGDTVWCFIVDGGMNWILSVPMALLSVEVFHWSLPLCVGFVALAETVKAGVCYMRFYSKKWINVFTGR